MAAISFLQPFYNHTLRSPDCCSAYEPLYTHNAFLNQSATGSALEFAEACTLSVQSETYGG